MPRSLHQDRITDRRNPQPPHLHWTRAGIRSGVVIRWTA